MFYHEVTQFASASALIESLDDKHKMMFVSLYFAYMGTVNPLQYEKLKEQFLKELERYTYIPREQRRLVKRERKGIEDYTSYELQFRWIDYVETRCSPTDPRFLWYARLWSGSTG